MTESLRVRLADLQRPPWPPLAWLRRHPVVVDVVVVLAACVPHLIAMIFRAGDVGWWGYGYPLLAITAAALMMRRRWPLAMLVVVAISCAASPLAQPGFGYPMIPFAFALYTVASLQPPTRALIGYGVGVASTALATIPYSLSGTAPPLVALLDPFALIALVIGLVVRGRRERRVALAQLVNERIENAASLERARIAAEMHDVVAHSISVMVALANGADAGWSAHPERARAAVGKIGVVGRDALTDIHRVLHILRGADADLDGSLHESGPNLPTLEALAVTYRDAGLHVELTQHGRPLPDDPALRIAVYRIVQEALTNTLRHATGASSATVTVTATAAEVAVEVTDDGMPSRAEPRVGHGLTGIRERARRHGGDSTAGPLSGRGWRTHATLRIGAGDA
ncbi:MAG: sensor histidine kinase [Microbacteriaceae bacterium]